MGGGWTVRLGRSECRHAFPPVNQKLFRNRFQKDGNRAIRGKPTIEQPLRDSADGSKNLGISEAAPLSSGVSFGYADTVGKRVAH